MTDLPEKYTYCNYSSMLKIPSANFKLYIPLLQKCKNILSDTRFLITIPKTLSTPFGLQNTQLPLYQL